MEKQSTSNVCDVNKLLRRTA